ncbi:DUF6691 family protein [Roseobacter sp. GAI101]|uniref:DUF6691 family protein n=1 Tax=Roseobacter sp. (strain GAI101) TaxID=391589 RepID=UPI000569F8DF|nr:DUF6691 family protein [Roseobacter sp. GAI101]
MRILISYPIGLIFGVGISISGMANPAKVLNFFDVAGTWDPSLGFIMGCALIVTFIGYRYVLKRPAPYLSTGLQLPTRRDLDLHLIGGSAVFGVGWGIAGFRPGGVPPAIGTFRTEVLIFVAALLSGIVAYKLLQTAIANRAQAHA